MTVDEIIEKTAQKVLDNLSGYSFQEQAYMLGQVADMLVDMESDVLMMEYGLTENTERNESID
jgi:hypothetical protein